MIPIAPGLAIDERELQFHFVRSSGPGGQNVNKVATAVQLRFDVMHSTTIPGDVRRRVVKLAGRRMTDAGILVIDARRFRTQERNRRDALDRLIDLLRKAAQRPKIRHKTAPGRAAIERRLTEKRSRAESKRRRRRVDEDPA